MGMRIALVAPPFIPVPPPRYGGTELFLTNLALGLKDCGLEPVIYANGESHLPGIEIRWLFPRGEWPLATEPHASLKDLNHSSWACSDAAGSCELIHLQNAPGLAFSRFAGMPPFVYTLHHPFDPGLAMYYAHFPEVAFNGISAAQVKTGYAGLPRMEAIHHGLDLTQYQKGDGAREYLVFLGRIAPIKGVEQAIDAALLSGIPLLLAGEIQPIFQDYWETRIRPRVDGRKIQYAGELDLKGKNEVLGRARALLFPIQWEEPFGLVMIEAMACGAPVLAFARGSAPEVVGQGISGWLCGTVEEMARRAQGPLPDAACCRRWVEEHFDYRQMARRYASLYARQLANRKSSPAIAAQPLRQTGAVTPVAA